MAVTPYDTTVDVEEFAQELDWEHERKATMRKYTLIIFPDNRSLVRSKISRNQTVDRIVDGKKKVRIIPLPALRWHRFFTTSEEALDFLYQQYCREYA